MHFSEDNSLPTLTFFLQTLTSLHISRLYWHTLLYTYFFLPKQISLQRHFPSSTNFFIDITPSWIHRSLCIYKDLLPTQFLYTDFSLPTYTSPYQHKLLYTNSFFLHKLLWTDFFLHVQTSVCKPSLFYADFPTPTFHHIHKTLYRNLFLPTKLSLHAKISYRLQ